MRRPPVFAALVLLGIGIDQVSKWCIFRWLEEALNETHPLIAGVLHLRIAENRGVAFSLLADYPSIILIVSVAVIPFIARLYFVHWRTARAPMIFALGLLLTGAVGNLIDRCLFGFVRDFIEFVPVIPVLNRQWAIFNVADICITAGVFLYLFCELLLGDKPAVGPASLPAAQPAASGTAAPLAADPTVVGTLSPDIGKSRD